MFKSKSIRHKIVCLSSMRIAICFEQVVSISRLTPFYKRRATFPFDTHMNAALVCLLLTFISWPWVPGHDIIFIAFKTSSSTNPKYSVGADPPSHPEFPYQLPHRGNPDYACQGGNQGQNGIPISTNSVRQRISRPPCSKLFGRERLVHMDESTHRNYQRRGRPRPQHCHADQPPSASTS